MYGYPDTQPRVFDAALRRDHFFAAAAGLRTFFPVVYHYFRKFPEYKGSLVFCFGRRKIPTIFNVKKNFLIGFCFYSYR